MAWFQRNRKAAQKVHKAKGRDKRLERELRKLDINPSDAFCVDCHTWYDITNMDQRNKHAH